MLVVRRSTSAPQLLRRQIFSFGPRAQGQATTGSRTIFTSTAGTQDEVQATLKTANVEEQEKRVFLPSFRGRSALDILHENKNLINLPKTKLIISATNHPMSQVDVHEMLMGLESFHLAGGGGTILVSGSTTWARTNGEDQQNQYNRIYNAVRELGIAPIVPLRLDGDQDDLMRNIDRLMRRGVGGFAFHPVWRFDLLEKRNIKRLAKICEEYPQFKMMAGMLMLEAAFYEGVGQKQANELHRRGRDVYPMLDYSGVQDFSGINREHLQLTQGLMQEVAPKQPFRDRFYTREGLGHGADKTELIAAFLRSVEREMSVETAPK